MAKVSEGPFHRVHRPHLTPEQDALRTQYEPQQGCRYCLSLGTLQRTEWLMEVPKKDGALLEFYCSNCGRYNHVPVASKGA